MSISTLSPSIVQESAPRRLPVVRCERVQWSGLDPDRRASLGDALFSIFSDYYAGFDRDDFASLFLARDDLVLGLLYGPGGRLAGFCSIRRTIYTASRRRYGVFSAGVYVDTDFKGGRVAAMFGLLEALRFKLWHPWLRVAYLGIAHTPAPYRLFTRTMARVYPSRVARSGDPPGEIAEVMRLGLADRGWPTVGLDPWVLATPMLARRSNWLERKPEMREDPDVRFFAERVPGWAERGHALAVWIPLDIRDIVGGALRVLRHGVARLPKLMRGARRDAGDQALAWTPNLEESQ